MLRMIIIALFAAAGLSARAQGDSTRYINGLPVSDDDTTYYFPNRDVHPPDELRPLTVRELPASVREALEEGPQYEGWKDTTVYYEENTGLYVVPVEYEEGIKIFGLNRDGDPVRYSEVDRP